MPHYYRGKDEMSRGIVRRKAARYFMQGDQVQAQLDV